MNIWWVRHGPTHAKTMIGWTDLDADLSDADRLESLRGFLPREAPVVSSDLRRAVHTADALADDRPRLSHRVGLREMHFGTWENRSFVEIEAEDPARLQRFWDKPGDNAPPDGESWNDLSTRVAAEVEALRDLGHGDLIVVAHFGVILSQIQRALDLGARDVFARHVDFLSVTRMRHDGVRWRPVSINCRP